MALIELASGVTVDEIAAKTEATYRVAVNQPSEAAVAG
jgi:acyl CoA:acetate/3-ketoacid CoA transferase beta subunit